MFFNNNLERPDVFLDEGIMFKVSPNPGLSLTHLRTSGPRYGLFPNKLSHVVLTEDLGILVCLYNTVRFPAIFTVPLLK